MSDRDPAQPQADSAEVHADKPAPGADPDEVRTNRGAATGAVPSSYGAGGNFADDTAPNSGD